MINTIQSVVEYRANWFFSMVGFIIPALGLMYLWQAVFVETTAIAGYTMADLVTYFILSRFLVQVIPAIVWTEIGDNIKTGELNQFLIRPINYVKYYFVSMLSNNFVYGLFAALLTIIFALFFWKYLLFLSDPLYWLFFLVSIILGFCLAFLFGTCLCLTAFWVEDIGGLQRVQQLLITLLSGALVPLDLLPENLSKLFPWLPYRYMLSFQAEIYLQRLQVQEILAGVAGMVVWCLFFLGLCHLMWQMGIKRYTAYGG